METATTARDQNKSIVSLTELEPGDHILVDTHHWEAGNEILLDWFSPSFSESDSHHNMLVVRPIDDGRLRVIHVTLGGVKEEELKVDKESITVVQYACRSTGEEAIEHARHYLSLEYDSNDEDFVTDAKGQVHKDRVDTPVDITPETLQGAVVGGIALGVPGAILGGIVGRVIGAFRNFEWSPG